MASRRSYWPPPGPGRQTPSALPSSTGRSLRSDCRKADVPPSRGTPPRVRIRDYAARRVSPWAPFPPSPSGGGTHLERGDGRRSAPSVRGLRIRLPRARAELLERAHDVGIELRAGVTPDLVGRGLDRPRLLVRALVDEHVEHVGDVDEAPLERDVGAGEAIRVAGAVPALVVGADGPLRG